MIQWVFTLSLVLVLAGNVSANTSVFKALALEDAPVPPTVSEKSHAECPIDSIVFTVEDLQLATQNPPFTYVADQSNKTYCADGKMTLNPTVRKGSVESQPIITVIGNYITIDLNGYALTPGLKGAPPDAVGISVRNGDHNIIKNGMLSSFGQMGSSYDAAAIEVTRSGDVEVGIKVVTIQDIDFFDNVVAVYVATFGGNERPYQIHIEGNQFVNNERGIVTDGAGGVIAGNTI